MTTYATGFSLAIGLTFDAQGDLFVADLGANKVLEVAPGGGTPVTYATGFNGAIGLAFSPCAVPEPASLILLGMG